MEYSCYHLNCVGGHSFRGHSRSTWDQLNNVVPVELLQTKEGRLRESSGRCKKMTSLVWLPEDALIYAYYTFSDVRVPTES